MSLSLAIKSMNVPCFTVTAKCVFVNHKYDSLLSNRLFGDKTATNFIAPCSPEAIRFYFGEINTTPIIFKLNTELMQLSFLSAKHSGT